MARPIQLCAPSTLWPAQFTTEQRRIEQALQAQRPGSVAATYQLWHIGSTAVPGLWAKPIIDMLLCVPDQASLDACVAFLQGLGYQHKGANGIVGRQYFVLPAGIAQPWLAAPTDGQDRTHHLHAFVQGHPASDSHLALRDFLRAHPQAVTDYNQVKQQAFAQSQGQSDRYANAKDAFVSELVQQALQWQRETH